MTPTTAATPAVAGTRRGFGSDVAARGREDGKLLGEARRTAVRAGRALPVAGAHQHFAFLPARLTLELVDRHGGIVAGGAMKLNRLREGITAAEAVRMPERRAARKQQGWQNACPQQVAFSVGKLVDGHVFILYHITMSVWPDGVLACPLRRQSGPISQQRHKV